MSPRLAVLIASLFALLVASGCSPTPAGEGCGSTQPCTGAQLCLQSADFPGGYCSQGCRLAEPSSCPSGSVCIDDVSGAPADAGVSAVCYQSCTRDEDCRRAGYACREKAGRMVCRNAM